MPVTQIQNKALIEYSRRRNMALKMFRPQQQQEPFFRSWAREFLVRGGNRSLVAGTKVWRCSSPKNGKPGGRPASCSLAQVEELSPGDTIVGYKLGRKRNDLARATVVSVESYNEQTYKLRTKRGYEIEGTDDHPVWACPPLPPRYNNSVDPNWREGCWKLLRDVPEGWYVRLAYGSYVGWSGSQDDEAYFHGLMDGDGCINSNKYNRMAFAYHVDESLHHFIREFVRRSDEKAKVTNATCRKNMDGLGRSIEWSSKKVKQAYLKWEMPQTPEAMASYIRGLIDADGCVTKDNKIVLVQKDEQRIRLVQQLLLMFGVRCSLRRREACPEKKIPNPTWRLQISGYSVRRYAQSIGLNETLKAEKLERASKAVRKPPSLKLWWDRVAKSEATGESKQIVAIETSLNTYVSNGIVSHNSGKSTCAAVKFAAIATDTPITLADGTEVNLRAPWQRGKKIRMWVIGFDNRHIGETIHRLVFQEGLFKVIRDKHTGRNRAFRQWEKDDAERESEVRKSPPLIPSSYIKPNSWDWENKKNREFKKVTIINPITKEELAEIYAYSSKADPKAGDPVDVIWIDEAIEYPNHYSEWQARLVDNRGCMFWSSWPAVDNDALQQLHERALSEADAVEKGEKSDPLVREMVITLSDNKALPKSVKEEALGMWSTPEERMARDKGEFVTGLMRMYPLFDINVHQAILPVEADWICEILKKNEGTPPPDWTRELILDPGTQHPAILFCAIPPPQTGHGFVVYDELYPGRADAIQLARMAKEKIGGYSFNRFIADGKAGKQQQMGYSHRVIDSYIDAFKEFEIKCEQTQHSFLYGDMNVGARVGMLQRWMHIQPNGQPLLRIVKDACPNLCDQLRTYRKAFMNKEIVDDRPAAGQRIDLAVCYDDQTEVLTNEGWKYFKNVKTGDLLGTMNMDTELLEYQQPSRVTCTPWDGEMVRIKGRRVDLLVTPNHRMVVRKPDGKLGFCLAKDLKMTYKIPLCPKGWEGEQQEALLYRKGPSNKGCYPIFGRDQYSGNVYCATVPNGTLVVRRNGRVAVCGNCLEYWASSHPRYVAPPPGMGPTRVYYNERLQKIMKDQKLRQYRESVKGGEIGPMYA